MVAEEVVQVKHQSERTVFLVESRTVSLQISPICKRFNLASWYCPTAYRTHGICYDLFGHVHVEPVRCSPPSKISTMHEPLSSQAEPKAPHLLFCKLVVPS
jgi:hypothetical protein